MVMAWMPEVGQRKEQLPDVQAPRAQDAQERSISMNLSITMCVAPMRAHWIEAETFTGLRPARPFSGRKRAQNALRRAHVGAAPAAPIPCRPEGNTADLHSLIS